MADPVDTIRRLQEIENSLEDALWDSVQDNDYEKALQAYETCKNDLESIHPLSEDVDKERKRVLSYCLMRMNDVLERLNNAEGNIARAEESLKLADESEDRVQILRSKLGLGIALLNSGNIPDAESHFTDIILQTQDETKNRDVIQVYGWTLIVRVNILLGKSLYNQARELANQALGTLSGIKNYAGLRTACSLLSRIYQIEGNAAESELYRQRSEDYAELAKTNRQ